jgi:ABC-2 type transport system permease protein
MSTEDSVISGQKGTKEEAMQQRTADLSVSSFILHPSSFPLRAWCYLVWLCIQRQARVRQMVWIALALLALMSTLIGLNTLAGRWPMHHWPWRWLAQPQAYVPGHETESLDELAARAEPPVKGVVIIPPRVVFMSYGETAEGLELLPVSAPWPAPAIAVQEAYAGACRVMLERSGFFVFSTWVVFAVFVGFLLPIWSLSFATEALGGERESGTLVWLLTRPLPRPSIYLAKYLAMLPWSMGLNLGGFGLLCALAGPPGRLAFRLYWPAIMAGTLAYCSLFHLLSAIFRRSAVVGLVYSFFLETIFGSMPGQMKRVSISFYTRCLMFDAAQEYAVEPEKPSIYMPVSGVTSWYVLLGLTAALVCIGMMVFARTEYRDLS